ncbi:hypothetical protein A6J64_020510 [Yersinia enterocolitica]|nr:hypothetical protein A6J63_021535 [Yersinia enterocolitica]PNM14194.1 hypothetical protein A6J64_020510 [Yersinia enterocolitica]PNM19158.1 hypothetical protein A6J65_009910 [Yersinia enterocolitica]
MRLTLRASINAVQIASRPICHSFAAWLQLQLIWGCCAYLNLQRYSSLLWLRSRSYCTARVVMRFAIPRKINR